ncbi:RHS repeat-associated core domain-containing protein, partial [Streptomyces sp. DSM 44915]
GHTTTHTWDRYDHTLTTTNPLGHTTHYTYNQHGDLTTITRPDGSEIHTEYNLLGLPTEVREPDEVVWRQAFDERGNRTILVDPMGSRTRYAYDFHGALTETIDALGQRTRFRNNAAGLAIAVIDPNEARTNFTRDHSGRVTKAIGPLGQTESMEYTREGWPTRRTDPLGGTEIHTWDAEGNLLSHSNANGAVTKFEYGPFDLPVAKTDPDGSRYEFARDTELRLTGVVNPKGSTWNYTYDAAGRLTTETDFDSRSVSYRYDPAGQLAERVNGHGQTVTFDRDPLGNMIAKHCDGETTRYTYDRQGRVVRADHRECTLVIKRDRAGRVTDETVNGRALKITYDELGRPVSRVTPSGHLSTKRYNGAGHLAALETAEHRMTFERDVLGREVGRRIGSELDLTLDWDTAGRLTSQRLSLSQQDVWQRSFAYRSDHHLVARDDHGGHTTQLELDSVGRITAVHAPTGGEAYTYDAVGNQIAARWSFGSEPEAHGQRFYEGSRLTRAGRLRYEYDGAGRVVVRQKLRLSKRPDTWRYTWNAEDRLTQVVTPKGVVWRYRYDPLGRRIAKERLNSEGKIEEQVIFTWQDSTLVEQTRARGPKNSGTRTLTWDYDGLQPLAQSEYAPQSEIDHRFFAIITDLVGTPEELVDEAGRTAWRRKATLWGISSSGDHDNGRTDTPLRFPGQYADPETGWHDNFHRHYDPLIGRYATPDPIGLEPGPNAYAYVDNPLYGTDPLGLAAHPPPGKKPRAQHLQRDPNATGSHTVFERDASGRVIRYQTWLEEPRSPNGWQVGPRFRGTGRPHGPVNPPIYYPTGGGRGEPATGENLPLGY